MKHKGFTLVELLVVISVIVLLISLLNSALRMCRKQATSVKCFSNVYALTNDLFHYAERNEDTFVQGFRTKYTNKYIGNPSTDPLGQWWIDEISDFGERDENQRGVFRCPSKRLDNRRFQDNILWGNYGLNRSICKTWPPSKLQKKEFKGAPLGRNDILYPSRTLLIVDAGQALITWWDVADHPPYSPTSLNEDRNYLPGLDINAGKDLFPCQKRDAIVGRHLNKTVNVGFVDGHAKRMKAQELLVERIGGEDGNEYKNLTPLWSPE